MKPILFNTDMVRAILEDRKTVTRRVVKPQPKSHIAYACMGNGSGKWCYPGKDAWEYWDDESFRLPDGISQDELKRRWTPPCHTGDILYVRETWAHPSAAEIANGADPEMYLYKADDLQPAAWDKWRPSIHMPKEAARLFLRVKSVLAERLQDITEEQARAEGCDGRCNCPSSGAPGSLSCVEMDFSIEKFESVWDSTIKPDDLLLYGWYANPWVWVIEFERCEKPKEE